MTIRSTDEWTIEHRMRWITGHVWPLITDRTFVVIESPYVALSGKTAMQLAGLHYVLRYGLYTRRVPFGVVTPAGLKKFATGNGAADKPAMVQTAAATFGKNLHMGAWNPAWPLDDVDAVNDEADALFCMAAGLHHTGLTAAPGGAMEPGLDHEQRRQMERLSEDWHEIEWDWEARP